MTFPGFEMHSHDGTIHEHEHLHVTHHAKGGPSGEVEHLAAVHSHRHNHAALEHAHSSHQNPACEHEHEGHIHNHSHPTES